MGDAGMRDSDAPVHRGASKDWDSQGHGAGAHAGSKREGTSLTPPTARPLAPTCR